MRRIIRAIPVLVLAGCATTGGRTVVSAVINCAEKAMHDTAVSLIATVNTDLAQDGWNTLLDSLAAKWDMSAVLCALDAVAAAATHDAMTSDDALATQRASRARAYLSAHGVAR